MRAVSSGTKIDGGNACLRKNGRVHPVADTDLGRWMSQCFSSGRLHGVHNLLIGIAHETRP